VCTIEVLYLTSIAHGSQSRTEEVSQVNDCEAQELQQDCTAVEHGNDPVWFGIRS